MPGKRISSVSTVLAKTQAVVVAFGLQREAIIVGAGLAASPVFQEDQELEVATAGQLVYRFETQPVFAIWLPKTHLPGQENQGRSVQG